MMDSIKTKLKTTRKDLHHARKRVRVESENNDKIKKIKIILCFLQCFEEVNFKATMNGRTPCSEKGEGRV